MRIFKIFRIELKKGTVFQIILDGHYDSFRSLTRANNKSEYIWKIFFKIFIPAFLVGTVATSVASVLLSWLMVGQFDYKFAYLPEKFMYVNTQSVIDIRKPSTEIKVFQPFVCA